MFCMHFGARISHLRPLGFWLQVPTWLFGFLAFGFWLCSGFLWAFSFWLHFGSWLLVIGFWLLAFGFLAFSFFGPWLLALASLWLLALGFGFTWLLAFGFLWPLISSISQEKTQSGFWLFGFTWLLALASPGFWRLVLASLGSWLYCFELLHVTGKKGNKTLISLNIRKEKIHNDS